MGESWREGKGHWMGEVGRGCEDMVLEILDGEAAREGRAGVGDGNRDGGGREGGRVRRGWVTDIREGEAGRKGEEEAGEGHRGWGREGKGVMGPSVPPSPGANCLHKCRAVAASQRMYHQLVLMLSGVCGVCACACVCACVG